MRSLFLENLPLKLLSLFLALILFVLVREDRVKVHELDIPVVAAQVPDDFVLVEAIPDRVRLTLRGRWSKISNAIQRSHKPYVVDVAGLADGDEYFFDDEELKRIIGDNGPTIVSKTPDSFTVRLEALLEKRVPVRSDIVGDPARGYNLRRGNTSTEPAQVTVRAPREVLSEIREILTVPINVTGLERDLIRDEVRLRKPAGQHVSLEVDRVRVEIFLDEVQATKLLQEVPVAVEGCRHLRACTPNPATIPVQVSGPLLRVEALERDGARGLIHVDASEVSAMGGSYHKLLVQVGDLPHIRITPTIPTVTLDVTELRPAEPPVVRDEVAPPSGPEGAPDKRDAGASVAEDTEKE